MEKLEDVKTNLITVRRIIFTPNVDLKDELKNTSIQITCFDENGEVLKRVTSGDSGEVEDNENTEDTEGTEGTENGGSQNQGGSQSQSGGTDTGGGTNTGGSDNTGGGDNGDDDGDDGLDKD